MAGISFPLSSTPGARAGEGQGRLINAMIEKEGDVVYYRRVPGLVAGFAVISTPRGLFAGPSGGIFGAWSGNVTFGTTTLTTGLAGTDGVTFAMNNAATPD